MTGLLDRYAARKRKQQENIERGSDVVPDQAEESSWPATDGGSEVQAIIISASPETSSSDRPGTRDAALGESGEAAPTLPAL